MVSIAIIGTGIAGMGCGYFLHKEYDLTIYEQNNYVGGHTNTAYVEEDGRTVAVDTGFIVFNLFTYPNLTKLFIELKVETQATDMSFSVQHKPTGLEFCGSGLDGLFAQRKNIFNPGYIRMLLQINRFNKESVKILDDEKYLSYSLHDYVKEQGYGDDFIYKYLSPMTSALWSTPTDITMTFPAVSLVRFFKNHGFLGLNTQFQWLTVKNGSWQYRDKLIAPFKDKIHVNRAAVKAYRENGKVRIVASDGSERLFDKVIFACHADQALKILTDPTMKEKELLGKFKYQQNIATLHTDESVMPQTKKTWSAWNYRIDMINGILVPCTVYYMNKLQGISDKRNYFVSINDPGIIKEEKIIRKISYEHPIFNTDAMKAQGALPGLNENGISYFCGSYFKYGFHEDAFTSALETCRKLTGKKIWQ
ncbi:MAG: FAD-dependent oxidoreductase [Cytophagaceae bacterium]|nr:FAD-dependent oxidoreductase [Cytophagaceae bacterium]